MKKPARRPSQEHLPQKTVPTKIQDAVSDAPKAEEALRESDSYEAIFQNAREGILVADSQTKRFKFANPAICAMLGYTSEELLRLSVADIHPKESLGRVLKMFEAQSQGEMPLAPELPCLRKDGTVFFADIKSGPLMIGGRTYSIGFFTDVTERKEHERSLRLMRFVMERTADTVFFVGEDGHIRYANPAACQKLGYDKEEFERLAIWDIDPTFPPEKRRETLWTGLKTGDAKRFETTHRTKDGRLVPVEVSINHITFEGEGLNISFCRDITERKRTDEALTKSHVLLDQASRFTEALLSSIPTPVFYKDKEGRYLGCNRAFSEMMGVTSEGIKGKTVHELWPSEQAKTYHDKDLELMGNPSRQIYEFEVRDKDGVDRPVIYAKDVFRDENDQVAGIVGAFLDISERKQAEETLHRLNRELQALSKCHQTLLHAEDEQPLLDDICRIICTEAGYRLAWVGYADHDEAKTIRLAAWAGFDDGYVTNAHISWADTERGRGPTGTAIRSGEKIIANDFATDPRMAPWRDQALKNGYRSSIALPLKDENANTFGALTIYSAEPNAFTPDEIRLLENLSDDLAFGITVLRVRHKRKRAEEAGALNSQRLKTLLQLNQMTQTTLQEITDFVLEEAVRLTQSKIGYLAFLNEDESVLTMHSWSKSAMAECATSEKPLQYPVETTGLWGEAVRQRRPIITNDYAAANPWKKGYPQGHVALQRHMNIPVFEGSRIVVVAGVGNKTEEYNQGDVQQLTLLMEGMWRILERKRVEDERIRLLEAEKAARVEAEVANKAKDDFLAIVSHELRTPLTAILGWIWLLRSGQLAEEERQNALDIILRNMQNQRQIVEDLIDVSSLSHGQFNLVRDTFDLSAVLKSVCESLGQLADGRGIRLILNAPGPAGIMGDSGRLQQVFWNLLNNAMKFSPNGSEVRVSLRREAEQTVITVQDSGKGIPPDFLPHLFEPFRQGEDPLIREHRGLGLGLAIVKRIVELHGGSVSAASAGKDRGSTFIVRLPAAAWPPPEQAASRAEADSRRLDGLSILVVEDDADTRRLIERLLARFGARVTSVADAAQAWASLEQSVPDLLLCDIALPGEDGCALIRKVRSRGGKLGSVPAAALTVLAREEDRARALKAGFQTYLTKPIEPLQILEALRPLVGRS